MPECWAAALGDCTSKASREHLVTESLFRSTQVHVQGFPWCKNEPKIVGLSSVVGKVLCERHNNLLSPVDQAASSAFESLREIQRVQNVRKDLKPQRWHVRRYRVDGPLLERWFLKTAINLALSGRSDLRWAIGDSKLGTPPPSLVRVCFGLETLAPFMGLYATVVLGRQYESYDTVQFAPLVRGDTHITGALFIFRGHQFVLSLVREELPEELSHIPLETWLGAKTSYHLRHMRFEMAGFLSQTLTYMWPQRSVA